MRPQIKLVSCCSSGRGFVWRRQVHIPDHHWWQRMGREKKEVPQHKCCSLQKLWLEIRFLCEWWQNYMSERQWLISFCIFSDSGFFVCLVIVDFEFKKGCHCDNGCWCLTMWCQSAVEKCVHVATNLERPEVPQPHDPLSGSNKLHKWVRLWMRLFTRRCLDEFEWVLRQYFIIGERDLVTSGEFDQPWKMPILRSEVLDKGEETQKSVVWEVLKDSDQEETRLNECGCGQQQKLFKETSDGFRSTLLWRALQSLQSFWIRLGIETEKSITFPKLYCFSPTDLCEKRNCSRSQMVFFTANFNIGGYSGVFWWTLSFFLGHSSKLEEVGGSQLAGRCM